MLSKGASDGGWRAGLDGGASRLLEAYEQRVGRLPAGAREALAKAGGTLGAERVQQILTDTCEPHDVQKALASVGTPGTPVLGHGGNPSFLDRLAKLRQGSLVGHARVPTPSIDAGSEAKANANSKIEGPNRVNPSGTLVEQTKVWDATETAARIAAGEISAVEVTQAAIARAKATEGVINAIVHPMFEAALQEARERKSGCFAGVPTFVKDMEDVAGAPTGYGTAALKPKPAQETAASVLQFMSTGPITLGKSTTAEFGLTATTEPVYGKPTCNPINPAHSSGGSSGGAASLVASGVVPIAHGGDGGGSIRIPAAFCGLVGLKATRGRLTPMAKTNRMPVKLATYGVLTRTVRDTAAFFGEVDQPIRGMAPIGKVEGPGKTRLRVGLFIDPPGGTAVDPQVRAAVMAKARELELQGHRVDFVPAPYDQQLVDDFLLNWGLLAAGVEQIVKRTPGADVNKLEPWTRSLATMARSNWWRIPPAVLRLRGFHAKYAKVFDRCDVMLSPTTAAPAPKLGYLSSDQPFEQQHARLLELLPYTPVQNAAGGPAISLPAGKSADGLPIGVQIAAPWGEERRLIELAYALEA